MGAITIKKQKVKGILREINREVCGVKELSNRNGYTRRNIDRYLCEQTKMYIFSKMERQKKEDL